MDCVHRLQYYVHNYASAFYRAKYLLLELNALTHQAQSFVETVLALPNMGKLDHAGQRG